MKKLITLSFMVGALLIVGFQTHTNQEIEKKALTVGALAPLTGGAAVIGERIQNGLELAKKELIESGTVDSLDIVYEDVCLPKETVDATKKLLFVDKVSMIASSACLVGLDAVVPILEEEEVIIFNPAANPESVLNKKYVFSTNFSVADDARNLAEFVNTHMDVERVAINYFDTSFGEGYYHGLKDYFEDYEVEVVFQSARGPFETDFRDDITKMIAQKPDVVINIHFGSTLGNLIKQTRELGLEVPMVSHYEAEDPSVLEAARGSAEGLIFSSSQPEVKTNKVLSFEQEYLNVYGELPDVYASNAYDSLILQVQAYVVCSGKIDCAVRELEGTNGYSGVSGVITIDSEDHSVSKPHIFKKVEAGEFVDLK